MFILFYLLLIKVNDELILIKFKKKNEIKLSTCS